MSASFTPGPWQVVDNRSLNGAFWICHPDVFTSHAEVRGGCGEAEDLGSPEANARLIAAAPELYEALESLVEGRDFPDGHKRARAILAKIGGES